MSRNQSLEVSGSDRDGQAATEKRRKEPLCCSLCVSARLTKCSVTTRCQWLRVTSGCSAIVMFEQSAEPFRCNYSVPSGAIILSLCAGRVFQGQDRGQSYPSGEVQFRRLRLVRRDRWSSDCHNSPSASAPPVGPRVPRGCCSTAVPVRSNTARRPAFRTAGRRSSDHLREAPELRVGAWSLCLPMQLFCPRSRAGFSRGRTEVSRRGDVQESVGQCAEDRPRWASDDRTVTRKQTEYVRGRLAEACGDKVMSVVMSHFRLRRGSSA